MKQTEEERIRLVTSEKLKHYNTTTDTCGCIDFNIQRNRVPNYKCKHIKKLELDTQSKANSIKNDFDISLFKSGLDIDKAYETCGEILLRKLISTGEIYFDKKARLYKILE